MFRMLRLLFRWGAPSGETPTHELTGITGGIVQVVAGKTRGVAVEDDGRLLRVFIAGVEVTDFLKTEVQRTMTLNGGSKAVCSFTLSQRGVPIRPIQGDEVIIWSRGAIWYAGVVDNA